MRQNVTYLLSMMTVGVAPNRKRCFGAQSPYAD